MNNFKKRVRDIINWAEDKNGVGESSNDIIVEEIKKELELFISLKKGK